ncbi:hypothetical protein [Burkholderia cenocepacia]|uniref:hypothetical protein n=1 Tax=Burkholderia cenocepacia TaxID=95486 RepID=UPI0013DF0D40|nr:hypothetical protein [Burkholderia cenocepacia]MCW3587427.1 hypothetical protein [Burkholderia cenocepacia]MCW3633877.1 hypothetical protein [Burkholderia cenocepacia]MCW5184779.1 hypothetical protein [Burkholderia cenocepacia]NGO98010.1 hypothetical protein [Burkholderia cenocepacia]
MFDDFSSWDGLSPIGALSVIGGFGFAAYLAYAFGFQSALEAATPCADIQPACTIVSRDGWFGIKYNAIKELAPNQRNVSQTMSNMKRASSIQQLNVKMSKDGALTITTLLTYKDGSRDRCTYPMALSAENDGKTQTLVPISETCQPIRP